MRCGNRVVHLPAPYPRPYLPPTSLFRLGTPGCLCMAGSLMAALWYPCTRYELAYFPVKSDTIDNVNKTGCLGDHKAGFWCNLGAVRKPVKYYFQLFSCVKYLCLQRKLV